MAGEQFNMRLSPDAKARLEALCARWGCSAADAVRIMISAMYHRTDIRSPLDLMSGAKRDRDALRRVQHIVEDALMVADATEAGQS